MEVILESIDEIASRGHRVVVIPHGYTQIGDHAFHLCGKLASVVIPETVTTIGEEAFDACVSLAEIEFPPSVTVIQRRAFRGCTSLESVSVPRSARWREDTFADCPKLKITRR